MRKPMVNPDLVAGDLTELVCGDVAGRESPSERTTFAFRGLAVGDLAVSGLAYVRARSVGALSA
jgi:ornithine cyclodeaminase/alanine dehydrogenase